MEVHPEGSAPAACNADLFNVLQPPVLSEYFGDLVDVSDVIQSSTAPFHDGPRPIQEEIDRLHLAVLLLLNIQDGHLLLGLLQKKLLHC